MSWQTTMTLITILLNGLEGNSRNSRARHPHSSAPAQLSLWIDANQVGVFSGIPMEIEAITDGHLLPYILDPNFQNYLPTIPEQVNSVNFTWRGGPSKKYFYNFDRLVSHGTEVLHPPSLSIPRRGRVPRRTRGFSITLSCIPDAGGPAPVAFTIGLEILESGRPLPGMPLHLRFQKRCPSERCANCTGNCEGCNAVPAPLCFPQCLNGGQCRGSMGGSRCECPEGYHGLHCEGGICAAPCLNRGKCIQKDTCECGRGFFGRRCEYSKCMIPCRNGGHCRGVNTCRCPPGFSGQHCEKLMMG